MVKVRDRVRSRVMVTKRDRFRVKFRFEVSVRFRVKFRFEVSVRSRVKFKVMLRVNLIDRLKFVYIVLIIQEFFQAENHFRKSFPQNKFLAGFRGSYSFCVRW